MLPYYTKSVSANFAGTNTLIFGSGFRVLETVYFQVLETCNSHFTTYRLRKPVST